MPGNLGNSPNTWNSEGSLFFNYSKFLKCLAIWEIFQIPNFLKESESVLFFLFRKILKCQTIWEYSNYKESREFPKYLGFWKIPQILGNLGNSPSSYFL